MASKSAFTLATELKSYLDGLLSRYDVDTLPPGERSALVQVKHQATDARLEARDYDYADTRAEQLQAGKQAQNYFEQLERSLLKASEYNLFTSIEVAELSAAIRSIMAELE